MCAYPRRAALYERALPNWSTPTCLVIWVRRLPTRHSRVSWVVLVSLVPAHSRRWQMDEPAMPIYSLLSSTRYDNAVHNMHSNTRVNGALPSPFMLLPYHFDRLMTAARTHGWQMPENVTKAALLEKCERAVAEAGEAHGLGPLKVRRQRTCLDPR